MKDQPTITSEKKTWVTPDIQLISGSEIMSGNHNNNTENAFGGIFNGFYGTNS